MDLSDISKVPAEDFPGAKKLLKARGGFVEPSTLKKAAATAKPSSEPQKQETQKQKQKPEQGKVKQKNRRKQEPQKQQQKQNLRRGLPRLADVELEEDSDGTFKLKISVQKPPRSGRAPKPDSSKPRGKTGKAQKADKPTNDKEADAVAERSQSRKALAGLKEGTNESKAEDFQAKRAIRNLKDGANASKADKFQAKKALSALKEGKNESKAQTHQAKKALAGLKDGKNESKAETHQKKKAMDAFKSKHKPKTDVDPAVRAFLDNALQELCTTQPDNPLQILAQMCRDKAAALGSEQQVPVVEEEVRETPTKPASSGSADSTTGPVTTVEEAVRRLKKYEDIGELGVKKVVLHVRGCTSADRQRGLPVRSCVDGVVS